MIEIYIKWLPEICKMRGACATIIYDGMISLAFVFQLYSFEHEKLIIYRFLISLMQKCRNEEKLYICKCNQLLNFIKLVTAQTNHPMEHEVVEVQLLRSQKDN